MADKQFECSRFACRHFYFAVKLVTDYREDVVKRRQIKRKRSHNFVIHHHNFVMSLNDNQNVIPLLFKRYELIRQTPPPAEVTSISTSVTSTCALKPKSCSTDVIPNCAVLILIFSTS